MKIQSTQTNLPSRALAPRARSTETSTRNDEFMESVVIGLSGTVPLLGAGTNAMIDGATGLDGNRTYSKVSWTGFASNLAGTASLVGGIAYGSNTAIYSGLALLGISGVTAGYAHSRQTPQE